jgi:quinolinate synthase
MQKNNISNKAKISKTNFFSLFELKNKIYQKTKKIKKEQLTTYINSIEDNDITEYDIKRLKADIYNIKKEKDIVILAHNYQRKEIQDIADFTGDSFELAKIITEIKEKKVIFCGVKFMAETAKILAYDKKIIFPEPKAGCPLASSISIEKLLEYKNKYKDFTFVCYINTDVNIKANCDVVVTSSNALKIIKKLNNKNIFFLPDMFLGEYIRKSLKDEYEKENIPENMRKNIILHNGFCPIHQLFTEEDVRKAKTLYPNAPIIAHPESSYFIQEIADYLVGTSGMIKLAGSLNHDTFIIGTEIDMIHKLKSLYPNKNFIPLSTKALCPNMKKITLQKVLNSLITEEYEIEIEQSLALNAKKSIDQMLKLST